MLLCFHPPSLIITNRGDTNTKEDYHTIYFKLPFICKYLSVTKYTVCKLIRHMDINKQTNRQTDKQTNRQTDKQTNRQTDKQTNRQTDKQTNRQTDKQTNRQTDKQTNRQHKTTDVSPYLRKTQVISPDVWVF